MNSAEVVPARATEAVSVAVPPLPTAKVRVAVSPTVTEPKSSAVGLTEMTATAGASPRPARVRVVEGESGSLLASVRQPASAPAAVGA